jgi:hypothetical protein
MDQKGERRANIKIPLFCKMVSVLKNVDTRIMAGLDSEAKHGSQAGLSKRGVQGPKHVLPLISKTLVAPFPAPPTGAIPI